MLVRDGELVGEGIHVAVGHDHAEIAALEQAGANARGATAYVTLEPCNHHGRTPPCTDALVRAGVARVVVGVRDPNPTVQGGGLEQLRGAGIEITTGVEERRVRSTRLSARGADTYDAPVLVTSRSGSRSTGASPRVCARAVGSPVKAPAAMHTHCGRAPTASWSGSAP